MLSLQKQADLSSDISLATFSTLRDNTSLFAHIDIHFAHWLAIHFSAQMIKMTKSTITHMECAVFALVSASKKMYELLGPGATQRWLYWKSRSREQVSGSSFFVALVVMVTVSIVSLIQIGPQSMLVTTTVELERFFYEFLLFSFIDL